MTMPNKPEPSMDSKLREIPEHLKNVRDVVRWSYNHGLLKGEYPVSSQVNKELVLDTAEKAIRKAVAEDMLELIGDEWADVYAKNDDAKGAIRQAKANYKSQLRQKIKEWSER